MLTPVVKSYCSDRGLEVCDQALNVFGGYGYTREYPVEQLLRDCKIATIYEGTNGIQAMDLLGRKLGMKKGAVFMSFLTEIQKTIAEAGKISGLEKWAEAVDTAVKRLGEIAMHMGRTAMSPEFATAFSFAAPFLDCMGDVIMAWMHLWRAVVAMPKLEKLAGGNDPGAIRARVEKNRDAAFYDGQLRTAEYCINVLLPVTLGKMDSVIANCDAAVKIHEKSFGGQ